MSRPDISTEEVARMWLGGASILSIAVHYDTSDQTIRRRISKARELLPNLPWDKRQPRVASSPTKGYTTMKDGRTGESVLRIGSVVRGRRRSK